MNYEAACKLRMIADSYLRMEIMAKSLRCVPPISIKTIQLSLFR